MSQSGAPRGLTGRVVETIPGLWGRDLVGSRAHILILFCRVNLYVHFDLTGTCRP